MIHRVENYTVSISIAGTPQVMLPLLFLLRCQIYYICAESISSLAWFSGIIGIFIQHLCLWFAIFVCFRSVFRSNSDVEPAVQSAAGRRSLPAVPGEAGVCQPATGPLSLGSYQQLLHRGSACIRRSRQDERCHRRRHHTSCRRGLPCSLDSLPGTLPTVRHRRIPVHSANPWRPLCAVTLTNTIRDVDPTILTCYITSNVTAVVTVILAQL